MTDPSLTKTTLAPDPRAAWLADRRSAITATDLGAILGVSKFATPIDVYLDKLGELPETAPTEWMEAGNRMQRPIIDWWAERQGVAVRHGTPYVLTRSQELTRIGASLDAQVVTTGEPVDAKNIGWKNAEWGEEGSDQIPLTYAVQLAVQMYVTRTPVAYLPVLFGGHTLVAYVLHRDLTLEAELVERAMHFWHQHVERRVPPPVDGSASWTTYLQRTFKQSTDRITRATAEQHELAVHLRTTLDQLKQVEAESDRLKNLLRSAIGEGYAIEGPNWKATWGKTADGVKTDWKEAFYELATQVDARNAEEIVKECSTVKEGSRRFTFNFKE